MRDPRHFRDTLSSVAGEYITKQPPIPPNEPDVCFFRHALALDEVRAFFQPEYSNGGATFTSQPQVNFPSTPGSLLMIGLPQTQGLAPTENVEEFKSRKIREVWFAGHHLDLCVTQLDIFHLVTESTPYISGVALIRKISLMPAHLIGCTGRQKWQGFAWTPWISISIQWRYRMLTACQYFGGYMRY